MKKEVAIALLCTIAFIFLHTVSANLVASVTPTSENASFSTIYNFTITNNASAANFTQINITFPSGLTFNSSTNGTSTLGNLSSSGQLLSWKNLIISNDTSGNFWINATASKIGNLSISISALNTSGNTSSTTLNVSVTDVTYPQISFDSSITPSNDSVVNQTYFSVKVIASDNVALKNITLAFVNSPANKTVSSNSSPFQYNFTNLSNGVYKVVATANDTSGNLNSTALRYVIVNYTAPSTTTTPTCNENWTCGNWSACNSTGVKIRNCTDQNSCGTIVNKPPINGTCVPACDPIWNCTTDWKPSPCTEGQIQIKECNDISTCNNSPENKTRLCPTVTSSTTSSSTSSSKNSSSSVSWLMYAIIGLIVVAGIAAWFVLRKLKGKKHSNGSHSPSHIGPGHPGSPPGYPPTGYPVNPAYRRPRRY